MIVVDGVSKTFKLTRKQRKEMGQQFTGSSIDALKNVSFTCEPGRIFCLLGPNGAGKTTALRIIATMLRPTEGHVTVDGLDTRRQGRAVRRVLGFSTGATALYDRLTPNELVLYYARLNGIPDREAKRRRDAFFDMLDVNSFADRRISKLSTGMRQKVSITRTLIHRPSVLVFDEATAGLDVMAAQSIHNLMRQLRDEGRTVLFSTHRMDEVELLADDLAILHEGALCYRGTYDAFHAAMQADTLEEEFIRVIEDVGGPTGNGHAVHLTTGTEETP